MIVLVLSSHSLSSFFSSSTRFVKCLQQKSVIFLPFSNWRQKNGAVEVNSVIMATCFEWKCWWWRLPLSTLVVTVEENNFHKCNLSAYHKACISSTFIDCSFFNQHRTLQKFPSDGRYWLNSLCVCCCCCCYGCWRKEIGSWKQKNINSKWMACNFSTWSNLVQNFIFSCFKREKNCIKFCEENHHMVLKFFSIPSINHSSSIIACACWKNEKCERRGMTSRLAVKINPFL